MSKNILILGIQTYNSGKTFFSNLLANNLINKYSKNVEIFKPISGSNYYYHADNSEFTITNGSLISRDLRKVHDDINHKCNTELEILNPVHTLFFPFNIDKFIQNKLRPSFEESFDQPGIVRYTNIINSSNITHTILKNESIEFTNNFENLLKRASEIKSFMNYEEMNSILSKDLQECIVNCFNYIQNNEINIIEAYNNYIPPSYICDHVDFVFLVGPGVVASIESTKFKKVVKFLDKDNILVDRIIEYTSTEQIDKIPLFLSNQNHNEKFNLIFDRIIESII